MQYLKQNKNQKVLEEEILKEIIIKVKILSREKLVNKIHKIK